MSSRRIALVSGWAVVLGACSSSRAWVEDGIERGTIRVSERKEGLRYEYRDRDDRVVRVELRTVDGALDQAHAIETRGYDAKGWPNFIGFTGQDGRPKIGPGGFACRRSTLESGPDGENYAHHDYFDIDDGPLIRAAGYSRETYTQVGGKLRHRRYFDPSGERVAIRVDKFDGVHEIRYAYLMGVTPVVMEMLVGTDGEPLRKRKIAGRTSLQIESYFFYSGIYGTYPGYMGTTVR